jgi:protein-tyrosine phosphatase
MTESPPPVSASTTSGRIDTHSHLLPGIDDGCKNASESLTCARALVDAGYSHVFCTPHIWPSLPGNTRQTVSRAVESLQHTFENENIPLTLLSGGELSMRPELPNEPDARILTYGLFDKYVLIDCWANKLPPHFDSGMKFLQDRGLTVILAHPERMAVVQDHPELAERFAEMGLLLQGNLQCFADPLGSHTRRVAEMYLKEGKYFVLGTDLHGPESLPSRLTGLTNARRLAGDKVIDRLTIENPRKLLPN